jgi:hypothetical protein
MLWWSSAMVDDDDDRPEVSLLFAVAELVLAYLGAIFVQVQNS